MATGTSEYRVIPSWVEGYGLKEGADCGKVNPGQRLEDTINQLAAVDASQMSEQARNMLYDRRDLDSGRYQLSDAVQHMKRLFSESLKGDLQHSQAMLKPMRAVARTIADSYKTDDSLDSYSQSVLDNFLGYVDRWERIVGVQQSFNSLGPYQDMSQETSVARLACRYASRV